MVLIVWYSLSYTIYGASIPELNPDVKASGLIDNSNVYDLKHTGISDDTIDVHTEPVIFEPVRNIKLSRATYKVTSYINFEPYLMNFIKFNKYLQAFKRDLKNEKKMGTLMDVNPNYLIDGKEWGCTQDMKDGYETVKCKFYRQYLRILKETTIIEELFQSIH